MVDPRSVFLSVLVAFCVSCLQGCGWLQDGNCSTREDKCLYAGIPTDCQGSCASCDPGTSASATEDERKKDIDDYVKCTVDKDCCSPPNIALKVEEHAAELKYKEDAVEEMVKCKIEC